MNLVFIFVFILLLVLVFILSENFQELVVESFSLAADAVRPHVPEILEVGRRVALVAMIALGILWAVSFLAFWLVGAMHNAAWEGFFLGTLVPLWSARYIIRKISAKFKKADAPDSVSGKKVSTFGVSGVLVVLFLIPFGIGLWSPVFKGSLNRSTENTKQHFANWLDKRSMLSEPETGIRAKINLDTVVYNENSVEIPNYIAKKDLEVEIVNLDNEVRNMFFVRLPNKHGDFTERCSEVYVPRNKVTLQ